MKKNKKKESVNTILIVVIVILILVIIGLLGFIYSRKDTCNFTGVNEVSSLVETYSIGL